MNILLTHSVDIINGCEIESYMCRNYFTLLKFVLNYEIF